MREGGRDAGRVTKRKERKDRNERDEGIKKGKDGRSEGRRKGTHLAVSTPPPWTHEK